MNEINSDPVFDVTVFDMKMGVANKWNELLDNLGADKKPPRRRYFKIASFFCIYPRNRQPTSVVHSLLNDLHLN